MPNLLIGVTGSVAAVKLHELIEGIWLYYTNKMPITPSDLSISIVLTSKALHFITQEDLQDVRTKRNVSIYTDSDEWDAWSVRGDPVRHIELRNWADMLLIAPLDANTMAKLANGLCDNLLTCIVRAWDFTPSVHGNAPFSMLRKPILVCPAMNTQMWLHPLSQPQLQTLESFGMIVIPPVEKQLICGQIGIGAMAPLDQINDTVHEAFRHCSSQMQNAVQ